MILMWNHATGGNEHHLKPGMVEDFFAACLEVRSHNRIIDRQDAIPRQLRQSLKFLGHSARNRHRSADQRDNMR